MQATDIRIHEHSRFLEIHFASGEHFKLPFSYLREHSPSAEMRYRPKLPSSHYDQVRLIGVEPVGLYALKLIFDDGHQTGLYTWEYLYELGHQQAVSQGC